ncbi:MAG: VOC family protein [Gammaproteobacteria bacterium]
MNARESELRPFHVALTVDDLAAARKFYGGLLGCAEGRSAATWVDFDLYGHQLVCHLQPGVRAEASQLVDGHDVPVPHCGVVLELDEWQCLADRLTAAGQDFIIEPYIRFRGTAGEQGTLFIRDPAGNALEFKGFREMGRLFAR